MCEFFSCIVTKEGKVFFTEEDSHETIIDRLKIGDNGKNFVRIEHTKEKGYKIDEMTIPEWYERIVTMIKYNVKKTFAKVAPAREEYEKIEAPAREEYEKIKAPAREEYEKIKAPAWEEYEKIKALAREEYEKIEAPALKEYEKIEASAREEYEKIKASALKEYEKIEAPAWEEYKNLLSKIKGYVKGKVK